MFLESCFRSRDPLLGILASRILKNLFEDHYEKLAVFSKFMALMAESDDARCF
jgi:hypothetical protein